MNRYIMVGHGTEFDAVLCNNHSAERLDWWKDDGYRLVVSHQYHGSEPCLVCDEYAQQTAAELRANTQ